MGWMAPLRHLSAKQLGTARLIGKKPNENAGF
jgi:hypothetical protein